MDHTMYGGLYPGQLHARQCHTFYTISLEHVVHFINISCFFPFSFPKKWEVPVSSLNANYFAINALFTQQINLLKNAQAIHIL